MSYNFEFLKKEEKYNAFTYACIEAEKSLVVSYATTAILSRRALELAIKWVFSFDEDLTVPYDERLGALIHNYRFKSIIDSKLFPMLVYIQKLGNKAVHSSTPISRDQAVLSLENLFEFISWIDYCYSNEYEDKIFDENLLGDNANEKKTRQELKDLYDRLGEKDRKLEEIIKENQLLRKENTKKRENNRKNREFKVDEISEFKTRKMYIDLELELSGWIIGQNCLEEVEVMGMPNASGIGYVDYVLYGDDGKPLAIVEAKKTSVDPKIGQVQAERYADCLERDHGIRPIIFYTNGFEYYLWDDKSYPERMVSGFYTKEELIWMIFKREHKKSLENPSIKDEITNRHYQKMAINSVCNALNKGSRKTLLVMATGSGKTRTAISIVDVLMNRGWIKNVLFLADRTALVKQAKKNFRNLLPNLSLCNLLDSKDNPESRMVFSTYPTMMNAIDDVKNENGKKLYTRGHFDLIIIDESHRSIYKKYQAIFNYFDSILLGLTATPRSDIDKNTYEIFELENNVPTFSYELDEAICDGYLVPYHTIETTTKFMEKGIHYDDLSEEEKEIFEETFEDGVRDISGSELNSFLFNSNTIDLVLKDLMYEGLKVEGGDKLGKTIIFAKNKKHAEFIIERFNILYPEYNGEFARSVYTGINYVDSTMEDFETKERLPQIAVSVDMLDTGIDIPEILNLVFFKKVRSKIKFWQMIGRGTRLCENLYGVGLDKEEFRIFDYCGNFEFFRTEKNGKEAKVVKSLTEKIFNIKLAIIKELQKLDYQRDDYEKYRENLIKDVLKDISKINESKFDVRMKLKYLHKFNEEKYYENLTDKDLNELEEHIAPLIPSLEQEEMTKRFDYLMYTIQYSDLRGLEASKPKSKVITTAEKLSEKGTIEKVKKQKELILKVQTQEFWYEADLLDYEMVRKAFRELIRFIEEKSKGIYYTNFTDEVLLSIENSGEYNVNNMENYRKKVNQYLKENQDDIVVYKLRNNKELRKEDIKHLEKILWQDLGTKEDYKKEFRDEPLLKLVSKIVGLDPKAAKEVFSEFLSNENLTINQMEFVNRIINHIIKNGSLDKRVLNEHPFNKSGNVVKLFDGKVDIAKKIISTIDKINGRLSI
ncbi:DEAD/DEAH box helicase family protein [Clostridium sp. D2Q-14]|uniref:DEAD/DEAH box helicase family protein n=1 Tax=Anaeromonas gelatinilytica TaxID=2683194 RepID=UPI00193BF840|nr:DEAD/DEAH box helicase family protein [Anaeromonas gelatinilytica]MBS4536372.1 DEAD/DEAH box helicase family protein [Anaeromonas gelatinilytica]